MNEEEMENIVDQFLKSDADLDKRVLMMMCREIERETRHRAVSKVYSLANEISHMNRS